jgi:hypothetical protein
MKELPADNVRVMDHYPREWARLICKLRWIGFEDEAYRLELAVSTVPPEERSSVLAGPLSTN